jgi:serine phosphatase RsbU (regulator of sigma subunit)
VGDVSGHDHKAAATMSQVLALLRAFASDAAEAPSRVLSRVDAAMADLPLEALATAVVALVEPRSGHANSGRKVRWSSAGHVPPLLRDPDGAVTRVEAAPDLLLGMSPGTPRFDHALELRAGSTLLLYTDGLIERRGQHLDTGIDALAATLSQQGGLDPSPLCEAILASTAALPAGDDDVALLVLRATG